jgi:hypothetical protein
MFFTLLLVPVSTSWARHTALDDQHQPAPGSPSIYAVLQLDLGSIEALIDIYSTQITKAAQLSHNQPRQAFRDLYRTLRHQDKFRNDLDNLRQFYITPWNPGHSLTNLMQDLTAPTTIRLDHHNILSGTTNNLLKQAALQPAEIISDLQPLEQHITTLLEVIKNALRTAQQQHRLAPDLLSPAQLESVFYDIRRRTAQHYVAAPLQQPSDLLALETTHLFDGQRAVFLLQVPIRPDNIFFPPSLAHSNNPAARPTENHANPRLPSLLPLLPLSTVFAHIPLLL